MGIGDLHIRKSADVSAEIRTYSVAHKRPTDQETPDMVRTAKDILAVAVVIGSAAVAGGDQFLGPERDGVVAARARLIARKAGKDQLLNL
jgi:hypothetical protein